MKVLVAVDESEGSLYALSWALDNLFTSAGDVPDKTETLGRLVLIHAQQPLQHFMHPVGPCMADPLILFFSVQESSTMFTKEKKTKTKNCMSCLVAAVYATSSVIDSVRRAQEQNSRNLLERATRVEAEMVIVDGDPKEMICRFAEQMQADLLVVGSRGLSKLRRAILGSVGDYCARHAKCPVLIVKPRVV
ncbi:hypothetical protein BHM03_00006030 [Ensete ventricosum]|nr:hypothetical protein BHM03_00006030 [Ensete ventricosum]